MDRFMSWMDSHTVRRLQRQMKQYARNRKRSRIARKKPTASKKAAIGLSLVLLMLFGAFAWSQSFLTRPAEGLELSIDQLKALGKEHRIENGTFLDEDNRLVGTFSALPTNAEEEATAEAAKGKKKEPKADKGGGTDAKGKDKGKAPSTGDPVIVRSVSPSGSGSFWLGYPPSDAGFGALLEILDTSGASYQIDQQSTHTVVRVVSTYLLPLLILAAFFGLLFTAGRSGSSGIGDVIAFGVMGNKRQRRGFTEPVTFQDVGGASEAVAELVEVVDYLRDPERYEELEGRAPEGRPAVRSSGVRQDPDGEGSRRRSRRAVLLRRRSRVRRVPRRDRRPLV